MTIHPVAANPAIVLTITLDTNTLPVDGLMASVAAGDFEFSIVTVTDRELEQAAALLPPSNVGRVPETMVWGETPWGVGMWAGSEDGSRLEKVIRIIADGSFPSPGLRETLTDGQRRQLRDAIIFCAHIRARRDIFVTDDAKGFVRAGRRTTLESEFSTCIMTTTEFRLAFSKP